jgi:hypothetical protein
VLPNDEIVSVGDTSCAGLSHDRVVALLVEGGAAIKLVIAREGGGSGGGSGGGGGGGGDGDGGGRGESAGGYPVHIFEEQIAIPIYNPAGDEIQLSLPGVKQVRRGSHRTKTTLKLYVAFLRCLWVHLFKVARVLRPLN